MQVASETPAESSSRRQSTVDKQNPPLPPQSPDGTKHPVEGNRGYHEITKTATLVFNALQPSYPWMHLTGLLSQACLLTASSGSSLEENKKNNESGHLALVEDVGSPRMSVCEVCTLMHHLLTSLPLDTQQQTQASRLPEVLSSVTALLTEHLTVLTARELSVGLSLCQATLHKLIPSVTLPPAASLSRPDSRASIGTFASLQLHALSQVSTVTRPPVVPEAAARESPPTECGIVQIGIEASEEEVSLSEENKTVEHSSSTSITGESNIISEDLVDEEAETSFISNISKLSTEDPRKPGTEIDLGKSEEPIPEKNDNLKDSSCAVKPDVIVDLFELHELKDVDDMTEAEVITEYEIPTDSGVEMGDITLHCHDLCQLQVSQEASEDEYESAPQSPNHLGSSPIHSYVKIFENFFLEFIQKILISSNTSLVDFQNMLYRSQMLGIDSLSELKYLLKECLHCCETKKGSKGSPTARRLSMLASPTHTIHPVFLHSTSPIHSQINDENVAVMSAFKLNPHAGEQLEVFKVSCSILVDLSSLPTTPGLTLTRPSTSIPQWLIGLLACVICGDQVSQEFTLVSISTLLELVMLAQSELSVWQYESALERGGEAGVVTVNITPLLLPTHTHILLYHTMVYQVC